MAKNEEVVSHFFNEDEFSDLQYWKVSEEDIWKSQFDVALCEISDAVEGQLKNSTVQTGGGSVKRKAQNEDDSCVEMLPGPSTTTDDNVFNECEFSDLQFWKVSEEDIWKPEFDVAFCEISDAVENQLKNLTVQTGGGGVKRKAQNDDDTRAEMLPGPSTTTENNADTVMCNTCNIKITSEEVVAAYIDRCKEVNPYLNAIVEPRYDHAIKEARVIDKMIASNDRTPEDLAKEYPLLGVPMTVKESIAVEGMSNDCGTVYPYRNPAKQDAAIIRLARAAGAIPIAVTNTPQLCMNWETYNNVTGLTMNPYDQKRTTGGSSGGEAALISAGASVMGVGSDIAGSLRLPPMFTGIFGHKPTPRLWSVEGHVPDCLDPEFEEYFTLGPITRYAEDLTLLLKVLKQPGSPDVPLDKPVDVSKLKFYFMNSDGSHVTDKIGSDVRNAMERAKLYVKNTYGKEVEELKIKNVEHMWEISVRVLVNIRHVFNIYTHPEKRDQWVSVWPEVLKKMFGMSTHSFTAVCYGPLQKFFDALPKSYYEKLLKVFEQIKDDFAKALSDDAVLLFPAYPYPAHLHYRVYYRFLNCGYLTIFNALGLPVTACPIGLTNKGLPVGIQIVANKYNDHLTIAVAKEFEKAFGGWIPPNQELINEVKTA